MKNKKIFSTLMKNYIVFVLISIVICVSTVIFLAIQMEKTMDMGRFPRITADKVLRSDYENIDIKDIKAINGWIEILDEDYNVVHVKGIKQTTNFKYDRYELYDLLGMYEKQKYMYSAKSFKGIDGRMYICIAILPQDKADIRLNLKNAPYELNKIYINNYVKAAAIFLLLFLLNIYLYSKITAKKISMPLEKISESINKMSSGDKKARISLDAENEFLKIKDAFNQMAEKLERVEEEKQKLEENRQQMFMDISHDLKTPITAICGYAKALSEGMVKEEEKKQRYLKVIYDKAARVTDLINNLFQLSKLENSELKLLCENQDFIEFIRGIVAECYEQIEEKGIELDLSLPLQRIILSFDKKELGRAVMNIVYNAIVYNPSGTKLRIEVSEDENGVILQIGDNGTGIPDNLKETIFEPFVRGDSSRNSDGGTGLGLAIAKKIVEGHGGTLCLDTNIGEYKTVFTISIKNANGIVKSYNTLR